MEAHSKSEEAEVFGRRPVLKRTLDRILDDWAEYMAENATGFHCSDQEFNETVKNYRHQADETIREHDEEIVRKASE
jgi:predicted thioredoxin/glutaredoxin